MTYSVKEIAEWLKDAVETMKDSEYSGCWYKLDNGLGICVYWCDGWGDDERDDVIQAEGQPDWGLVCGIKVIDELDQSGGGPYYWNFPYFENGDIATEDTGIVPNEDYEKLAKVMLDDYDSVKDLDIDETGLIHEHRKEEPEEVKVEIEDEVKEESMKENLNSSPYKDIIASHFDYSGDFEFLEVVSDIIDRVDNFEDDEDIYDALDNGLIYSSDQWKVLEHYCTPTDASWEVAYGAFLDDIFSICATIAKGEEDEDEEEIEDEN